MFTFSENEFLFVSPNRYVFPGAEVFDKEDESDCSSNNSDSDTDSDDEASDEENNPNKSKTENNDESEETEKKSSENDKKIWRSDQKWCIEGKKMIFFSTLEIQELFASRKVLRFSHCYLELQSVLMEILFMVHPVNS